jgi:hypothetical protein
MNLATRKNSSAVLRKFVPNIIKLGKTNSRAQSIFGCFV